MQKIIKEVFLLVIVSLLICAVAFGEGGEDLSKKELSVFTQNMYGPAFFSKWDRFAELRRHIDSNGYDVVFLQEVIFYPEANKFKDKYNVTYVGGRFGPRGGLVVLSKEKPKKVEFYKFDQQGSLFNLQLSDRILEKGFLVLRYDNVTYIDMHFTSIYGNSKNHKYLKEQVDQFVSFLNDEIKKDKQLVMGGDFNFNNKTDYYKNLTNLFVDNSIKLDPIAKYDDEMGKIDFIFSSSGRTLGNNKANYSRFVSDHPGIGAMLSLK